MIVGQGDDIVVLDGKGATKGHIQTSYGPRGSLNDSSAKAYPGSLPTDPGEPITPRHDRQREDPGRKRRLLGAGRPGIAVRAGHLRLDSLARYVPAIDDQPPESRLAVTTGSSEWLWNAAENWRFDRACSGLVQIIAALPADNDRGRNPEAWTQAPTVTGTIELAVPEDFARPEGTTRWIDPAGTTLILRYEPLEPTPDSPDRRRIRLAEGCFLLIEGNRVAGWQLEGPARFITGDSGGAPLPGAEAEAVLGGLFSALITVTDDARLDALDQGDLTVREELRDLDERLEPYCARHDSRALEMRRLTRQVLEDFGPRSS